MALDLWLYFLAVLAVILLPGMDMAYVLASSVSGGRRGAVASVLGIASGGAIHVAVGATGIAAVIAVFPGLYHLILSIGTLYLVWIGWNIYRSADAPMPLEESVPVSSAIIYRRAVTTCLLNPKAYAFTLAIFPAFVHSDVRSMVAQTLALGMITAATQIVVYGSVAALAVRSRQFMNARRKTISRTMGALLIGAAMLTGTQAWSVSAQEPSKSISINKGEITSMTTKMQISNANEKPGRNGFDFEVGDWHVENRRIVKPMQEGSPWETFTSTVHMEKLPGGIGNFDTFVAPEWRPNWMGMAIRVFNGETGLWSIFLLNSKTGGIVGPVGHLDVPVVGKFVNGTGVFEGDDNWDGVAFRCRYTWSDTLTDHPKWQQDFSFDGGKTWKPNWYMVYTRIRK
ncbi:MAG: LysE family translocator [Betaproteobacteria bacterium]